MQIQKISVPIQETTSKNDLISLLHTKSRELIEDRQETHQPMVFLLKNDVLDIYAVGPLMGRPELKNQMVAYFQEVVRDERPKAVAFISEAWIKSVPLGQGHEHMDKPVPREKSALLISIEDEKSTYQYILNINEENGRRTLEADAEPTTPQHNRFQFYKLV